MAGEGNDIVLSQDDTEDLIDCGPGTDIAVVGETEDGVYDCEELRYPPESEAQPSG